jgi:hypothetical protein
MKKVTLKESELVGLISKIVSGAVAEKKKQWIAENEKKNKALIESKIEALRKELLK